MPVGKAQIFLAFAVIYMVYYLLKVVHRPKLYYYPTEFNKKVIGNCSFLNQRYWPLFLFHHKYCQLVIFGLIAKIYPLIYKLKYQREIFILHDGQKIGLDWI